MYFKPQFQERQDSPITSLKGYKKSTWTELQSAATNITANLINLLAFYPLPFYL